jgi:acetyl-CoA carboxylase biotin carboxyl carrier protein
MTISPSDINSIVKALQESDWDEAAVVIGDVKISVARNGVRLGQAADQVYSPVPAAEPQSPASPAVTAVPAVEPAVTAAPASQPPAAALSVVESSDVVVTAPSVGVFLGAPEPGAAPFIALGGTVSDNDTVCIVEIMKLMNYVAAGTAGVVSAIHVEDGQAVQFGTPLFSIRPVAS